jgi:hypothetical protein
LKVNRNSDKVRLPKPLLGENLMTSNSQEIIQDIRTEFEMMLDFVIGEQARTATADQMERRVFKLLLRLGAKLLTLFFVMRSQACSRETAQTASGQELPYHRDTKRGYVSIFGKLEIWRPYFYKKGLGGQTSLDAELSLGEDSYSDLVRELSDYLAVYNVYHKTSDILLRLLGLKLSTRVVEENIAEDAVDVEAYYAQKPPPAPTEEAEILVAQADGKGVPMIIGEAPPPSVRLGKGQKRGRKKEAIVTTVYTIAPKIRTPQEVVDSYFLHTQDKTDSQKNKVAPKPQHKHIWATLDGKDTALTRLAEQASLRQGEHIQHQVMLSDGCEALQSRLETHLPNFTLILDFIHASEYLWDVANSVLGEKHPQRLEWMADKTLQMLSGKTEEVINRFRQLAKDDQYSSGQHAQLHKTANYFERNLSYMDYVSYLANGYPIASGVIEGACRHFVKDRCELSGMRWHQKGVENLFRLRAVAENDDWDDYHAYRRQQRHHRLYQTVAQPQTELEWLTVDNLPYINSEPSSNQLAEPINADSYNSYQRLPFAI